MRHTLKLSINVITAVLLSAAGNATTYTYVDLGAYNGAYAITQGTTGYIVGTNTSSGHTAFYIPYTMATLGTGGTIALLPGYSASYGLGVANLTGGGAEMVGWEDGSRPQAITCVFTTTTTPTAVFTSVMAPTSGFGINASGHYCGWYDGTRTGPQGISDGGTIIDPAPNSSTAYAINANGVIIGVDTVVGTGTYAAVASGGGWSDILLGMSAVAINDNSSYAIAGSDGGPCFYDSSTKTDIGTYQGSATGINTSDTVVGYYVNGSSAEHAFVAYGNSTLVDLNSTAVVTNLPSAATLVSANAINNAGYIVGTSTVLTQQGKLWVNVPHGFLLVP